MSHTHTQHTPGLIHFLIKLYADGKMSQALVTLKPGDAVEVSEQTGSFDAQQLARLQRIDMICGGTGKKTKKKGKKKKRKIKRKACNNPLK